MASTTVQNSRQQQVDITAYQAGCRRIVGPCQGRPRHWQYEHCSALQSMTHLQLLHKTKNRWSHKLPSNERYVDTEVNGARSRQTSRVCNSAVFRVDHNDSGCEYRFESQERLPQESWLFSWQSRLRDRPPAWEQWLRQQPAPGRAHQHRRDAVEVR